MDLDYEQIQQEVQHLPKYHNQEQTKNRILTSISSFFNETNQEAIQKGLQLGISCFISNCWHIPLSKGKRCLKQFLGKLSNQTR